MPLVSAPRIDATFVRQLEAIVGSARVSQANVTRALYGRDCWPKTLLWTRQGRFPNAPDVVVWPETTAEPGPYLSGEVVVVEADRTLVVEGDGEFVSAIGRWVKFGDDARRTVSELGPVSEAKLRVLGAGDDTVADVKRRFADQ